MIKTLLGPRLREDDLIRASLAEILGGHTTFDLRWLVCFNNFLGGLSPRLVSDRNPGK